jgi:hypothetical protein
MRAVITKCNTNKSFMDWDPECMGNRTCILHLSSIIKGVTTEDPVALRLVATGTAAHILSDATH